MTAATGSMGKALEYLETTLADAAAFRTWVGASGDDAQQQALNRIHQEAEPAPADGNAYTLAELEALRPFALIWTDDGGYNTVFASVGAGHDFKDGGRIKLRLTDDVPAELSNDPQEMAVRFRNAVDGIISDLWGLAGTAGYLAITGIALDQAMQRSHADAAAAMGDFLTAELGITWGQA